MSYAIIFDNMPVGCECENCHRIDTQVVLSVMTEFSDSGIAKITTRAMCEACVYVQHYTIKAAILRDFPPNIQTVKGLN